MDFVEVFLAQSATALDAFRTDPIFVQTMREMADGIVASLRQGGKLLLCGNGGSAGDAQHIAGEFVCRLMYDRAPLPAIALTVDTSVITAIGNDYGYEDIFVRQVQALGNKGAARHFHLRQFAQRRPCAGSRPRAGGDQLRFQRWQDRHQDARPV